MPTEHKLELSTTTDSAVSVKAEGQKAGMSRKKGWFQRVHVGKVPQRGHAGKFAFVEKFMKRVGFGNWYSEKITDSDTGVVVHECHEPLDQHQNHGSSRST